MDPVVRWVPQVQVVVLALKAREAALVPEVTQGQQGSQASLENEGHLASQDKEVSLDHRDNKVLLVNKVLLEHVVKLDQEANKVHRDKEVIQTYKV